MSNALIFHSFNNDINADPFYDLNLNDFKKMPPPLSITLETIWFQTFSISSSVFKNLVNSTLRVLMLLSWFVIEIDLTSAIFTASELKNEFWILRVLHTHLILPILFIPLVLWLKLILIYLENILIKIKIIIFLRINDLIIVHN